MNLPYIYIKYKLEDFFFFSRFVGNFLVTSPEFCFVVEDDDGMCGYATAAPDTKELAAKSQSSWLQTMRERYPKLHKADLSPAEVCNFGHV